MIKMLDWLILIKLSFKLQLGNRYGLLLPLVLLWPGLNTLFLIIGWRQQVFVEADVQNVVVGFPLYCLAIGIGARIIASEVQKRTLEVGYTIGSGIETVWWVKYSAIVLLLLVCQVLLTAFCWLFLTVVPVSALLSVFVGICFYLAVAMWFGAWFKNELMAGMATGALLALNLNYTDSKWLPLFNQLAQEPIGNAQMVANLGHNYLFISVVTIAVIKHAHMLSNNKERMLG